MLLDELEPKNEHFAVNESNPSKGIIVKNLTARWDNVRMFMDLWIYQLLLICFYLFLKNNSQPTLDKVSVEVKPGELLAVVGPVGAGKVLYYII